MEDVMERETDQEERNRKDQEIALENMGRRARMGDIPIDEFFDWVVEEGHATKDEIEEYKQEAESRAAEGERPPVPEPPPEQERPPVPENPVPPGTKRPPRPRRSSAKATK